LILNPDEEGRFDSGFEVFSTIFSSGAATVVSAFSSFIS
jgi:hypothetical protein